MQLEPDNAPVQNVVMESRRAQSDRIGLDIAESTVVPSAGMELLSHQNSDGSTRSEHPVTHPVDQPTVVSKSSSVGPANVQESRVNLDSDIVDAPSIGPKTAAKFYAIRINTIGEFLAAAPES